MLCCLFDALICLCTMLLRLCLKPARWKLSDFVGLLVDDFVSIEIKKIVSIILKRRKNLGV